MRRLSVVGPTPRGGRAMAVHLMRMLLNLFAAFTLVSILALVMIV
ncbi:hypothetical protein [Rhizobium sp. CC-YZS058]|nr:hypothetical protein [Rhizobium sp. CC-YZS058]MEA3536094.1 hypothetical protein [Rhizobium sp. CC-YZS058]